MENFLEGCFLAKRLENWLFYITAQGRHLLKVGVEKCIRV